MPAINLFIKRACFVLAAGIIIVSSYLAFRNAVRQPFHLDEAEEATMGLKFSRIGPKTFLPVAEGNMPVTHPLLYTFTHALVQKVFGPAELPLRLYGVFHFLLSLFLSALILFKLLSDKKKYLQRTGLAILTGLYLVNPLLVQHSVVINADNNILASTILLFLYFFIDFEMKGDLDKKSGIKSRLKLAVLFSLCLWSKELAPSFLLCGIIVYRILSCEFKKMLLDLLLVGITGFIIFWLGWWLYCFFTGTDVLGFIKFTLINKSKQAFTPNYFSQLWERFFYGLRWHIYWVSAAFFTAGAIFVYTRVKNFFLTRKAETVDFIFVCALSMWVPFQLFRPTIDMLKYHYPAYNLLLILVAWTAIWAIEKKEEATGKAFTVSALQACVLSLVLIIFTAHYYTLGDYLLGLWGPLYKYLNGHFLWYYYLPLGFAFILISLFLKIKDWMPGFALTSVLLIFPINIALSLNQAKADYLTFEIWLNYGEKGLGKTVEYLSSRIQDGSVTVLRQDIEYYLVYRKGIKIAQNIPPEKIFQASDRMLLLVFLSQSPVEYFVADKISSKIIADEEIFNLIGKYFILEKNFGDFYIFRRITRG
ncbi:MAG: hypothetical protein MUF05_03755 [Candidatus Omnitrophica bacterium]|jgi:hypothetical protein|nr:hypothetical protein [Candidatus Omnitrophota bacterium]